MEITKKSVNERGRRRVLTGVVRSNKMQKTIIVEVPRFYRHPKWGKFIRSYTVCYTHDEKQEGRPGDTVDIVETRPLSRTKRWRLLKIVKSEGRSTLQKTASTEKS